jgi:hypothetical protein
VKAGAGFSQTRRAFNLGVASSGAHNAISVAIALYPRVVAATFDFAFDEVVVVFDSLCFVAHGTYATLPMNRTFSSSKVSFRNVANRSRSGALASRVSLSFVGLVVSNSPFYAR